MVIYNNVYIKKTILNVEKNVCNPFILKAKYLIMYIYKYAFAKQNFFKLLFLHVYINTLH